MNKKHTGRVALTLMLFSWGWLNEHQWAQLKALEALPVFKTGSHSLTATLEQDQKAAGEDDCAIDPVQTIGIERNNIDFSRFR